MKRVIAMLLACSLILCVCPLIASANAPGPMENGAQAPVNPIVIGIFLIVSVLGIVLTIVLEWLVCRLFGIGKEHKKLIICTNLVTQIVLRILQLFIFALMPEGISFLAWSIIYLTVLELLVYLCEFLIYTWRIPEKTWKECLYYTVTANTISLFAGLLLLFVLL